jgi:hypothetical protein
VKTRSASIAERAVIYGIIIILVCVGAGIAFKLYVDFAREQNILQSKKKEFDDEKAGLEQQALEKDRVLLRKQKDLATKEADDERRLDELNKTLDKLKKTLVTLPTTEVWPDLIHKIETTAKKLNIIISNQQTFEKTEESLETKFTEFHIELELAGEYTRVMEFIWTIENNIKLKRYADTDDEWNAIVKITEGGFNIQNLMTEDDQMNLKISLVTFFRGE